MSGIEAILVATDLHEKSDGALRHGAYLAGLLDARLVVTHVVSSRDLRELDDTTHQPGRRDAPLTEAKARTGEQIARVVPDVAAEVDVRFGDPAIEIIAAAREHGCDLVVVAVASRSRLGKLLLGSHSQQVLLESPVPVIGVKPGWVPPQ